MSRKSIRDTDQWEISVEGLTFRAEWTAIKEWSDNYLVQLAAWRKTSRGLHMLKLHMPKCSPHRRRLGRGGCPAGVSCWLLNDNSQLGGDYA